MCENTFVKTVLHKRTYDKFIQIVYDYSDINHSKHMSRMSDNNQNNTFFMQINERNFITHS